METLKLIPQVFFDLLARLVPGCAGLVLFFILYEKNLQGIVNELFGEKLAESVSSSFFLFLGMGYVIGVVISPAAKMVQRLNELGIPFSLTKMKKALADYRAGKHKKNNLTQEKEPFSEKKLRYDRLRLEEPEVGALCAKIRAEFTMHNSLAVIFALGSAAVLFSDLKYTWGMFVVLVLLTFAETYRGSTVNDTFNDTVAKFTQIIKERKSGTQLA